MSTDPRASLQSNGMDFTPTIHKDTYPAISPLKQNLQGLHVLITGASKGIGRATALSYAAAGASAIVIAARSDLKELEREIEATAEKAGRGKPKVVSLKLDVRSKEDVEKAAEVVKKELGHLDVSLYSLKAGQASARPHTARHVLQARLNYSSAGLLLSSSERLP